MVDISTLKRMHFDAMASLGILDGHVTGLQAAILDQYSQENGDGSLFLILQLVLHI